jgi:hypothetical protein
MGFRRRVRMFSLDAATQQAGRKWISRACWVAASKENMRTRRRNPIPTWKNWISREIHFRPELFKYNDAGVDTRQLEGQSDLGFAGFRVFKACPSSCRVSTPASLYLNSSGRKWISRACWVAASKAPGSGYLKHLSWRAGISWRFSAPAIFAR